MISVYVQTNGDVIFKCSVCDLDMKVPLAFSKSPFWETFNGIVLLQMLAHYKTHDTP